MSQSIGVRVFACAFALAFAAGGAALGCKKEPTGPTREEVLMILSTTICARGAECAPTFMQLQFAGDTAACSAREYETIVPVLDQPGVTVTSEQGLACNELLAAADCPTFLRGIFDNDFPAGCVLAGTLADGTACVHPYQCASASCERETGVSCGTCAARMPDGSTCSSGADCLAGSTCGAGLCVPYGESGAACDADNPCHTDLGCIAGTCGARSAEGVACTDLLSECDFWAGGLACNPITNACMALSWVGDGDGCGVSATEALVCAASSCYPSPLNGSCTAYAPDGAACDDTNGPSCEFHAHCVGGVCEPLYDATCL